MAGRGTAPVVAKSLAPFHGSSGGSLHGQQCTTAWSNSPLATSTCLGLCNRAGLTPMLMVGICRIQRFPRISSLNLKPLAPCQVIYTSHVNTKIWKLIIGLISIERFGNIRLNLTLWPTNVTISIWHIGQFLLVSLWRQLS